MPFWTTSASALWPPANDSAEQTLSATSVDTDFDYLELRLNIKAVLYLASLKSAADVP